MPAAVPGMLFLHRPEGVKAGRGVLVVAVLDGGAWLEDTGDGKLVRDGHWCLFPCGVRSFQGVLWGRVVFCHGKTRKDTEILFCIILPCFPCGSVADLFGQFFARKDTSTDRLSLPDRRGDH